LGHYSLLISLFSVGLDDYGHAKKVSKLPPLAAQDKYGKLPPLNGGGGEKHYEHSASPKKTKLKELNKVYKVNIGNLDDITDKYSVLSKAARKDRGGSNISKNYVPSNIEYAHNGIKLRKDYNDNY